MAAAPRLLLFLAVTACGGGGDPPVESASSADGSTAAEDDDADTTAAATGATTTEPSTSTPPTTSSGSGSESGGVGCTSADECGDGEFCDFADDSCGVSGMAGVCAPAITGCTDEDRPVCTCGDIISSNICEASTAGRDVAFLGECELDQPVFRCGFSFCISGEEYCLAQAGAMPSAECIVLPPVCDPPDCSCVTNCCGCDNASCCSEFCINDGGDLTYTCP